MNLVTPIAPVSDAEAFTMERWNAFWSDPDPERVRLRLAPSMAGYWPRTSGRAVRGADDYTDSLAQVLALMPDFRARALDYRRTDDVIFIWWSATATTPVGPNELSGVDRLVVRDGLFIENRIFSDHPVFELLAERLRFS